MKNNNYKKNSKMQRISIHHLLALLVPSIAIASIIVGLFFVPTVNQSSYAQLLSQPQQQQNQNTTTTNINLAIASEAARNLAQKLGVNSTEVSITPGQNMSDLNQKLAPGGSLANYQEQLKGLGQQIGINGTLLSQLKQQLPASPMQLFQQLDQVLNYIP